MNEKTTETLHDLAEGLDVRPLSQIANILVDGQIAAAKAAKSSSDAIVAAARTFAETIQNGGCVHYVAAGSSGLMAAADAQELGGTFSIPASQLRIHKAGGLPIGVDMPGNTEDATRDLNTSLAELSERDAMIAVSASGTTPYTLAAAQIAKSRGAKLIAIANNPNTPLLQLADHPILLETPPEVLAGSTRMGAGTAQKIALNMLSTLMAVRLGHIHDGMMINLYADNIKLKARAKTIICKITGVSENTALGALHASDGVVKPAILIAALGVSKAEAQSILAKTNGHLRPALTGHQDYKTTN